MRIEGCLHGRGWLSWRSLLVASWSAERRKAKLNEHFVRGSIVDAETDMEVMEPTIQIVRGREVDESHKVVESLPELRRLEIWKARRCDTRWMMFPEGNLEKGEVHVEVVREGKLDEVREAHFANVLRARYERRAWGEYLVTPEKEDAELFMKEGFVLDFAYQGRRRSEC